MSGRQRTRIGTKPLGVLVVVAGLLAGAGLAASTGAPWAQEKAAMSPVVVVPGAQPPPAAPANPAAAEILAGDLLEVDPGTLPGGLVSYRLADGRYVVLDPDAELPAQVAAELPAAATAVLPAGGSTVPLDGPGLIARAAVLETYDASLLAQTGRSAVVVFPAFALANPDARELAPGWVYWGRNAKGARTSVLSATQLEATTAAQAWIGEQDDPGLFQLIVTSAS